MPGMDDVARSLILIGVLIVAVGLVLLLVGRIPFVGNLPGDLRFQAGGVSCFVPLATSILLSIILTLLLNLIGNWLQRR
jgi:Protein of unknown function (DUF2905)